MYSFETGKLGSVLDWWHGSGSHIAEQDDLLPLHVQALGHPPAVSLDQCQCEGVIITLTSPLSNLVEDNANQRVCTLEPPLLLRQKHHQRLQSILHITSIGSSVPSIPFLFVEGLLPPFISQRHRFLLSPPVPLRRRLASAASPSCAWCRRSGHQAPGAVPGRSPGSLGVSELTHKLRANLIAMASNLIAMASNLIGMASNQ